MMVVGEDDHLSTDHHRRMAHVHPNLTEPEVLRSLALKGISLGE